MDRQTFWQEIGKISSEFDISNHPLVNAIHAGTATKDQIRQLREGEQLLLFFCTKA